MADSESKPTPQHAFATTHWSVVIAAGDSTRGDGRAALEKLCQMYWFPLYVFVQRKGIRPDEAQDLTQAFFEDFLERNQVTRADRSRGRFRSFLVRSLENFLHNEWRHRSATKRGGGQPIISLDALTTANDLPRETALSETPEEAYARQWALTLLEQTNRALEAEWADTGRSNLFRELLAHLWSDLDSVPYPELCGRFDITPVNLRVTFHRFRQRYRELLRSAVAATVAEPDEIDDELRFLMRSVGR